MNQHLPLLETSMLARSLRAYLLTKGLAQLRTKVHANSVPPNPKKI